MSQVCRINRTLKVPDTDNMVTLILIVTESKIFHKTKLTI